MSLDATYIGNMMTTAALNAKLAGFSDPTAAKNQLIETANAEVASMLSGVYDIDDMESENLPFINQCAFKVFRYLLENSSGIVADRVKAEYIEAKKQLEELRDRKRVALDSDGETPLSYQPIAIYKGKESEAIGKIRRVQGGFCDNGCE